MYLVRSGRVRPSLQSLRYAGQYVFFWSSTISTDSARSYSFYSDGATIIPVYPFERVCGYSVHCIVRSGIVHLYNYSLMYFGFVGRNQSRTSENYSSPISANAYFIDFNAGYVTSSNGPSGRLYGLPVRCLVYKFKSVLRP